MEYEPALIYPTELWPLRSGLGRKILHPVTLSGSIVKKDSLHCKLDLSVNPDQSGELYIYFIKKKKELVPCNPDIH